jgi:hypothetical protein
MDGRRPWHFGYGFLREPEQSRKAPGAALLWSFLAVSLHSERILQGWGLLYAFRKAHAFFLLSPSGGDRLLVQPFLIWFHFISTLRIIGKPCISFSFSAMVRHRGKPRRGSAWAEHKEQRRREEELERALALASSILRKRAWAEGRTELDSIIEQGSGCSRVGKEADTMLPFPSCVVEEDMTLGNLPSNELKRDMDTPSEQSTKRTMTVDDDLPGCVIEEIPWPEDLFAIGAEKVENTETVGVQRKQAVDVGEAMEQETAPPSGSGGGTQGPLLSDEHLALVFELRSHLADLEHRALLMGQRMDLLLDAFSGAPAQRKCPLCTQTFAIPARTWQAGGRDTSPGA